MPDFVDVDAVHIFVMKNPVPTLLGDLYHSIHYKTEKRRGSVVSCCAPLFYKWFKSHLHRTGAFVDTWKTSEWSARLMGLTARDIVWYDIGLFCDDVIYSCGGFPNVPLVGRKGGINYNPSLALRHFGYALKDPPRDKDIMESLYFSGRGITEA